MNTRSLWSVAGGILCVAAATAGIADKKQQGMAAQPAPSGLGAARLLCPANASPDSGEAPASDSGARLREFEAIMDRYYRGTLRGQGKTVREQAFEDYKYWAESGQARLKVARAKLNKEEESLLAIRKQIDELDQRLAVKPNREDSAAVDTYNALVDRRQAAVRQHNVLAEPYGLHIKAYNDALAEFQAENMRRDEACEQYAAAYNRWTESRADRDFFVQLKGFYAELHQQKRTGTTPELNARIEQVRRIRRELFEYAVAMQKRTPPGLLYVEATLCDQEPCYLLVDTGASKVSLSLALVEALGLTNRLGEEVRILLADGKTTSGRRFVIPKIAALGQSAEDVEATIGDEEGVGFDGLLGQSYLGRFILSMDHQHPDKVILRRRGDHAPEPAASAPPATPNPDRPPNGVPSAEPEPAAAGTPTTDDATAPQESTPPAADKPKSGAADTAAHRLVCKPKPGQITRMRIIRRLAPGESMVIGTPIMFGSEAADGEWTATLRSHGTPSTAAEGQAPAPKQLKMRTQDGSLLALRLDRDRGPLEGNRVEKIRVIAEGLPSSDNEASGNRQANFFVDLQARWGLEADARQEQVSLPMHLERSASTRWDLFVAISVAVVLLGGAGYFLLCRR